MKISFLIIVVLLGITQMNEQCGKNEKQSIDIKTAEPTRMPTKFNQLPEGIEFDTEVEGKAIKNDKGEVNSYEITSVEQRLDELNAKYKEGKLVDDKNKEIKFFKPLCRGVSQGLEEDQRESEKYQNEFAQLKKKYTVIVLYCDLRKLM
jgi:hypothetical protein